MMSPKKFFLLLPVIIFLAGSSIWFLILSQTINFTSGFLVLNILVFIIFWRGFLISRNAGELFFLKNKRQIINISLILTLGFSELIWAISFLPFTFFILSGLLSVIFITVFSILTEYFKQKPGLFLEPDLINFRKILMKNIFGGIIIIIIVVVISSWLPLKVR